MEVIWWAVGFMASIRAVKSLSQERRALGGRLGYDSDHDCVA